MCVGGLLNNLGQLNRDRLGVNENFRGGAGVLPLVQNAISSKVADGCGRFVLFM